LNVGKSHNLFLGFQGHWALGKQGMGKGKGVWFDKLTNRGKGERLNLFLFPFPFNLFPCLKSTPSPNPKAAFIDYQQATINKLRLLNLACTNVLEFI
jgi:hypothetical protein